MPAPAPSGVSHSPRGAAELRFEQEVVSFFIGATEVLGVPKSVAAIYGVVFASARPLCFGDIEERLNLSKGSISQGLRLLTGIGALKAVEVTGDRREHYTPDMQLRKLIQRFLENRLQTQLEAGEHSLDRIIRRVHSLEEDDAKQLTQRLKHLRTWHVKARALLPLAKTFLKLGG
jgi:HTH-type transcriptional regulator, glycine betaine synthesis regulator